MILKSYQPLVVQPDRRGNQFARFDVDAIPYVVTWDDDGSQAKAQLSHQTRPNARARADTAECAVPEPERGDRIAEALAQLADHYQEIGEKLEHLAGQMRMRPDGTTPRQVGQ